MACTPIEINHSSNTIQLSGPSNDLAFLFPEGKPVRNSGKGVYIIIGLQGDAWIEIDGNTYRLQRNTLVCLTPNHLLSRSSCSGSFRFEYLFFEHDFLSDFPLLLKAKISDKMGTMPFLSLAPPTCMLLERYYDLMLNRYRDTNCQIEIIKGLLFSFILEISRIYSGHEVEARSSRKNELADGFFRLLHAHYKAERTMAFYAGELCISDKYLSRVIKEVTGNTFHFWVSDFIIKEAKLLLRSTEISVTEIAEELRFPNSSFFARFFKKHIGISPMQFKKDL